MSENEFGSAPMFSDDSGGAPAGNPADNGEATPNGSDGGSANNSFVSGLQDEDNRRYAETKGLKSMDDMVKSYRNLETKLGQGLQMKPEGENGDFTPEQWAEFGKKVGAPESKDFYEFQRPEIPDNVAYDEPLEHGFKDVAHKYKLTKQQANGVYKDMAKMMVDNQLQGSQVVDQLAGRAHSELEREWGGSDSPVYQENAKAAFQNIKQTPGLLEAYEQAGLLVRNGSGYNPTSSALVMHHASMANATMKEPGGFDGFKGGSGGTNPFAQGSENFTAQGQLVKTDPDKARAYIRQAGGNPSDYGL